jgi:hypothetical protein
VRQVCMTFAQNLFKKSDVSFRISS